MFEWARGIKIRAFVVFESNFCVDLGKNLIFFFCLELVIMSTVEGNALLYE